MTVINLFSELTLKLYSLIQLWLDDSGYYQAIFCNCQRLMILEICFLVFLRHADNN
jgi:hypothetical protein